MTWTDEFGLILGALFGVVILDLALTMVWRGLARRGRML